MAGREKRKGEDLEYWYSVEWLIRLRATYQVLTVPYFYTVTSVFGKRQKGQEYSFFTINSTAVKDSD